MKLILLLLLCVLSLTCPAWAYQARVVDVHDGDTITLEGGDRVRLAAIDAPESAWPGRWSDQPGAKQARATLAALVLGRVVEVIPAPGQGRSHKRLVAWLEVDDTSVNAQMVVQGMAWMEPRFCRPVCQELAELQGRAKEHRVGLWADCCPVPPWEWRKRRE